MNAALWYYRMLRSERQHLSVLKRTYCFFVCLTGNKIDNQNNWLNKYLIYNFRGKNVLNQKSELQKALSKHKEKKIMNQVKEHKETPGEFRSCFIWIYMNINFIIIYLYIEIYLS